jgi:hypothetical protein
MMVPVMRVPGPASTPVGWNCTISMSRSARPARSAIAMPSQALSPDGVWYLYMVGPPPVPSSTARACTSTSPPVRMSTSSTPAMRAPSREGRSATARCSSMRSMPRAQTCSARRLTISMPVRSPLCTVRSKVWPANAFWWMDPSALRSKKQPQRFSNSRIRRCAPTTSVQARSWSFSHLPPSSVSMKCRSAESPAAIATL